MLGIAEHFSIIVRESVLSQYYIYVRNSWVLVVTQLVVSGTRCIIKQGHNLTARRKVSVHWVPLTASRFLCINTIDSDYW